MERISSGRWTAFGIALLANPAFAQQADAPPSSRAASGQVQSSPAQPETPVRDIIVTGTRLRGETRGINPVISTDRTLIQAQGIVSAEDIIRQLPSAAPGRSASTNNNGSGNTQIDLRNLGVNRTLVLMDGRRAVASDFNGVPDIDAVPTAMIQRVDVVTGGASTIYGSDAIAGVVNFVLRDKIEGVEANAQFTTTDRGDGNVYDASLVFGTGFADDRGSLTGYLGYTRREPITRSKRSWAQYSLASNGTSLVEAGSSVTPQGSLPELGLMFTADRRLVADDGHTYNNVANHYLIVPQKRYVAGVLANYRLMDSVELYVRGSYSWNHVERQLSEPTIENIVSVNYGNPLLSAQERAQLFGPGTYNSTDIASFFLNRRLTESRNFVEDNRYTTIQFVGGFRGDIGSHFQYDVSAQYGRSDWTQLLRGDLSFSRFQQGLIVNPDGSCADPTGGCVPIDVFTAAPGAITPAQVAFYSLPQLASSTTEQTAVTASLSGDIGITSPLARQPIAIAVGAEYRRDQSAYIPDSNLAVGNNLYFGASPALSGSNRVIDLFGEIKLPLIKDKPLFESLDAQASYRHSDYRLAGPADAYGFGATWFVVDGLGLRGSFQRSVRAPNIGELFALPVASADSGIDPCFQNNGQTATGSASLCRATGQPTAAYNTATFQCPTGQCTTLIGGNEQLSFEKSNTRTFGLIVTPSLVKGLSFTVDYYDIDLRGAIRSFGTSLQNVLNNCYGTGSNQNPVQDPNNIYCRLVVRGPQGQIYGGGRLAQPGGYVSLQNRNSGYLQTSGIDFNASYRFTPSNWGTGIPGQFEIGVTATRLASYKQLGEPNGTAQQCVGTYGLICGQPIPKWRAITRLAWAPTNASSVLLQWRYFGPVTLDQDVFDGSVSDPVTHRLGAQSYFDLSGSIKVSRITLRAGVRNLMGRNPPLISRNYGASIFGLSNTFPGTYDVDRTFFAGMTVKM